MSSLVGKIRMRLAAQEDSELIFEWRNHRDTRRYFFDPSPVDPEAHKAWFSAALKNPSRYLLIGEDASERDVGVVRFDQEGNSADMARRRVGYSFAGGCRYVAKGKLDCDTYTC
jgi:hypothetical protein